MPVYLVTGAAGFIGSHVVERLLDQGYVVKALDNFSTGKRENLSFAEGNGNFHLLRGDVRMPEDCHRACEDVDCVLHLAALGSVPRSVADPLATHRSNLDGTLNLLVAARDAKVRRFVYSASSSAYGDSEAAIKNESLPANPISPYGVTKRAGEQYCAVFHQVYGLATVSLRYFGVFGPRQDAGGQYAAAIPAFVTALLKGEAPTIFGDGEQTRDFTYVANVVDANLSACTSERPEILGRVFNIASGDGVTINTLYQKLAELLDSDLAPRYVAPRAGDIRHSRADIALARAQLDYEVRVGLDEGLTRVVAWYRQQRSL